MSTHPTPVTVVRPRWDASEFLTGIIRAVISIFLTTLLVWWLLPIAWAAYDLGYWRTMALVVAVRMLVPSSGYFAWTKAGGDPA